MARVMTRPVLLPIWFASLWPQSLALGRRDIVGLETRGHALKKPARGDTDIILTLLFRHRGPTFR